MSYTKITGLPDGGAVKPTDQLVIARDGHTFAIEADEFISASNAVSMADLQEVEANLASTANTVSSLSSNVTGLQGTVANNTSNISTLAANAAAVTMTLSLLQANVANNASAISAIASNAALSGPAISALQGNVSALQGTVSQQGNTIGAVQANLAALSSSVSMQGANVSTLQASVANNANAIGALTANATLASSQIKTLQGNVTSLQGQIDSVAPKPSGVFAGLYDISTVQTVQVDTFGRLLSVTSSAYPHKAWRLRIDSTSSGTYCSLASLEFRTSAGVIQKPSGGTAFTSGDGNGSTADAAFDSNAGSRWVAAYPVTFPAYIGYIYGTPITIAEMLIQSYGGYDGETPSAFAIEYSDDTTTGLDGTWTAAAVFTTPAWTNGDTRLFECAPPTVTAVAQSVQVLQGNVSASLATLSGTVSQNSNAITVLQGNAANSAAAIKTLQINLAAVSNSGGSSNGITGVVQSAVWSTGNATPAFTSKPTPGNTLIAFVAYFDGSAAFASGWNDLGRNPASGDYSRVFFRKVLIGDDVTAANFVTYGPNGGSQVVFEIQGAAVPAQADLYFVDDAGDSVSHETNIAGNQIVLGFASGGSTQVTVAATTGAVTTASTIGSGRSAVGFYSNASTAVTATLPDGYRTFMMMPLNVSAATSLSALQENVATLQGNVANLTASYSTLAGTVSSLVANGGASSGAPTAYKFYRILPTATRNGATAGGGTSELALATSPGNPALAVTAITASATLDSFVASNMIDGNTSTFWTNGNGSVAGVSIDITLATAAAIQQIRITPRQDSFSDEVITAFDLYASLDGATYVKQGSFTAITVGASGSKDPLVYTVSTIVSGANAAVDQTANVVALQGNVAVLQGNVAFLNTAVATLQAGGGGNSVGNSSATITTLNAPRAAKFWRLRQIGTSSSYIALSELTFATTVGGAQAAVGGTPIASTVNGSYPLSMAFDGQTNGDWYNNSGDFMSAWIGYQFSAPVTVAEVRIDPTSNPSYMSTQYAVDLSDDGKVWSQVAALNPAAWAPGVQQQFTLPPISGLFPNPSQNYLLNAGIIPATLDVSATIKTPKIADFTYVDSAVTRIKDTPVGISYFSNTKTTSTTTNFTTFTKPVDFSSGAVTVTIGFTVYFTPSQFQGGGLALFDASGKFVSMEVIQNNQGNSLEQNNWNSVTSYGGTAWNMSNTSFMMPHRGIWWMKMQGSTSGVNVFISPDGVDWWQAGSTNTLITAPTKAGFVLKIDGATGPLLKGTFFHFDVQPGLI